MRRSLLLRVLHVIVVLTTDSPHHYLWQQNKVGDHLSFFVSLSSVPFQTWRDDDMMLALNVANLADRLVARFDNKKIASTATRVVC